MQDEFRASISGTARSRKSLMSAGLATALGVLAAAPALAQTVADFYKDKQLTIMVAADIGAAHDAYARVLARHLGSHIPGKPSIVVQNMQGASGVVGANHLANVAPKDGSLIAALYPGNVIDPITLNDPKKFRYDVRKLLWVGNISPLQNTCFTWHTSPVKTLDDAKKREVIVGSNSATSSSSVFPNVINQLLGTKFKVITGYSTGDMKLGVERGELDGICGWAYDTLMAQEPKWVVEKKLNFLAQSGLTKLPELPDVPMVSEFTGSSVDKAVFRLLDLRTALGRPYVAPEGVPAERIAALRQAFAETMSDPAYRAEAKKANQAINFVDHKGMEAVIADVYAMPQDIVDKVAALTSPPPKGK